MTTLRFIVTTSLSAAAFLGGCAGALPVFPTMTDAESLAVIAERQGSVTTISAECTLVLTDVHHQTVTLDGVLVANPPSRVRLRAWKFGNAVFDLTLDEGRVWVMVPEQEAGSSRIDIEAMQAQRVGEAVALLGPSYFQTAQTVGGDAATLVVRGPALGRDDVVCEIDRRTLTARRFVVTEKEGLHSIELFLDEYAIVDGIVWPMQLQLRRTAGVIQAELRTVDLNGDLPAGAFIPPTRAKAIP